MAKTSKSNAVLVARPAFTREPGHLYFVDKDGDVCKRFRNRGHTPSGPLGENHPTIKVAKTSIKRRRGYWYYVDGQNRVFETPMFQTLKSSARSRRRGR